MKNLLLLTALAAIFVACDQTGSPYGTNNPNRTQNQAPGTQNQPTGTDNFNRTQNRQDLNRTGTQNRDDTYNRTQSSGY